MLTQSSRVSSPNTRTTRGEIVKAAQDVTFTVPEGRLFTLLGPSGCGKTTTLRSIAGLERPRAGEIAVNDRVVYSSAKGVFVAPNRRGFGMVFQSYAIWPHMNVFQNAAFPLEVGGRPLLARSEIRDKVMRVLTAVQLDHLAEREATKLSGGQQQRLALARALVMEPALLLLDEPLSNLDAKLREKMRFELKRLQRELRITTVYVTHDQSEALALSHQIAVMNEGRIQQIGTPREIYERPANQFVADFVGNTQLHRGHGRRRGVDADGCLRRAHRDRRRHGARRDQDLRADERVALSVRPEDVELSETRPAGDNVWEGRVEQKVFLGEAVDFQVKVGARTLLSRQHPTLRTQGRRSDLRAARSGEVRRARRSPDGDVDRWASDVIVDLLHAYDLPYAALNPGASYRGLHDSIVNYGGNRPAMLLCQHEETAVQIAHGYAKASGKPMVAILHNLVGLLHANMAIYYAYIDRAPVFIVGATGPMDETKRRPRIDWIHTAQDQGDAVRAYTKWDYQPHTIDGVPESFARGLRGDDDGAARSGLHVLRRVAAGAEARSRRGDAAGGRGADAHAHRRRPRGARGGRRSDRRRQEAGDHRRIRRPRARRISRARGAGRDGRHPRLRRRQPPELPVAPSAQRHARASATLSVIRLWSSVPPVIILMTPETRSYRSDCSRSHARNSSRVWCRRFSAVAM